MNIEFDRKEGTEADQSLKNRKTVTLDRKVVFGWWLFLFSVAGWMFYLGIVVGRESAPVYFDMPQLDSDLMSLIGSSSAPDSVDVVLPEANDTKDLEFFEALRENKGVSKKIQEIDQALQSRSRIAAEEAEKAAALAKEKAVSQDGESEDGPLQAANDKSGEKKGDASEDKSKPGDGKSSKNKPPHAKDIKEEKTALASVKPGTQKKESSSAVSSKQTGKTSGSPADKSSEKPPAKTLDQKKQTGDPTKKAEKGDSGAEPRGQKNLAQNKPSEKDKELAKDKTKPEKSPDKPNDLPKLKPDASTKKPNNKPEEKSEEKQGEKVLNKPVNKSDDKAGQDKNEAKKADQPKSGKYTIQAGAVKTSEDASKMIKKLAASGISASVVKGKGSDGSEWFRIRIGTYGERDKAVKMAETVKDAGFPAMVINVPQE